MIISRLKIGFFFQNVIWFIQRCEIVIKILRLGLQLRLYELILGNSNLLKLPLFLSVWIDCISIHTDKTNLIPPFKNFLYTFFHPPSPQLFHLPSPQLFHPPSPQLFHPPSPQPRGYWNVFFQHVCWFNWISMNSWFTSSQYDTILILIIFKTPPSPKIYLILNFFFRYFIEDLIRNAWNTITII